MAQLNWVKDPNDYYYKLNSVDLTHQHFDRLWGVYVIGYFGPSSRVIVYVGRGKIKDRFQAHRNDDRIQYYASNASNILWATWAMVSKRYRAGVEAYLHQELDPLVPERAPTAVPIPVNLPWD